MPADILTEPERLFIQLCLAHGINNLPTHQARMLRLILIKWCYKEGHFTD